MSAEAAITPRLLGLCIGVRILVTPMDQNGVED